MPDILQDKVALITGGGSGIGQATSLIFAREGAKVVVSDMNAQGGEETVSKIKESGGDAIFIHADVSKASEVEAMVTQAVGTYGRLDCAFNNAGIGGGGILTHEHDEDTWNKVIAVNLSGVWLCMKYEIEHMLEQGGGAIVNTASIAGLIGWRNAAAYSASKHGVVGLTKTAALEYAQQGIRVNCVCPGAVDTPMVQRAIERRPGFKEFAIAGEPVGRLAQPSEVGEAVAWLSSDAASFVTGHAMTVAGGWTAQ